MHGAGAGLDGCCGWAWQSAAGTPDQALPKPQALASASADPVELGLFHHRFMAIAERMGERLRLTSRSVNIRERLDFSCALFDRRALWLLTRPISQCIWDRWVRWWRIC